VIIATPNHLHREPAVAAMRKGCRILLEKPVASSMEDLKAMWSESRISSSPVIVGFVLRYAPFYKKLYELVTNSSIGRILVISAEELMSDRLSSLFARGNWRNNAALSGGLMLEKCCHDIDILNWFSDSKAVRLSSLAKRTFLLPRDGAASHCKNCKFRGNCRFDRSRIMESFKSEDPSEIFDLWATSETDDSCIYDNDSGYPDHQTINIEYGNGVLCHFTVAQAQPTNTRTMRILGTEGQIYADFFRNQITVFKHAGPNDQTIEVFEIHHDGSGHGGSDSVITEDFLSLLNGSDLPERPGLKEGIESAMICFAADTAAKDNTVISIENLRKEIFIDNPLSLRV
jgi:predicted dehydrogenase